MRVSILFSILLLGLAACGPSEPDALFTLGASQEMDDGRNPLVTRIEVEIDVDALAPGQNIVVKFPLPDRTLKLELERARPEDLALAEGAAAWVGAVEEGGEAFVMRIGRSVEASLQLANRSYRLRSMDGNRGILEVFDTNRFREHIDDGVVDPNPPRKPGEDRPDSTCEDPSDRVDVMVLYTPDARDASGGVQAIENEIAFAVGRANLSYLNSSAAHRLNLIYAGVVSYNEATGGVDSNTLLGDLADTNDGILDSIHGLRDAHRADLVSLLYEVDDGGWCGWGNTQETADADTTDHRAFTVVQRSCAGGNLSFAHEIGHNMGAKHDRANAGGTLDFNFGHIQPVPSDATVDPWRTVMSYNSPCKDSSAINSCPRVPWFSNPNVSRSGDATGVPLASADSEHNVNVFAQNDGEVSRYRCLRSDVAANVWMKDRWEDEGGEPDPATAGKAMWQSPYIWIRLAQDANLEHEHEHQNPVLGQTNHVYVKLHNSGAANETADLELYFANASTNLNDPASWTQIDSQALTVASGVEVVRFEWNNLPGSGHYCLLARWNAGSTPLAFTNVGQAVRADNDLIWRNVNIQDLGGDPEADSAFGMAGDRESRETFLLIETKPMSTREMPWNAIARARIRVDAGALDAGNLRFEGIKQVDDATFEVPLSARPKLLGPFLLKPGEETLVKMRISADPALVKALSAHLANPADFEFTASQILGSAVDLALTNPDALFEEEGLVLGGVTYVLRVPAAN